MNVLSFGEVLWDIYPDDACIGGAPMNFAAHVVKLGGDAALLSAVGKDDLGQRTLQTLRNLGINAAHLSQHPDKPTGQCLVTLGEQGVPSYRLLDNTAWDHILCDSTAFGIFDVLYFGTLALRHDHNRTLVRAILAANRFDEVFVDINLRAPFYGEDSIAFACGVASILKISDEELPFVLEMLSLDKKKDPADAARQLTARFETIKIVVITCGDKGALAFEAATDRVYSTEAVKTTVCSTVGAGDSFSAAFLTAYRNGKALPDCLSLAAQVAAFVVAHKEAVPDYMNAGSIDLR